MLCSYLFKKKCDKDDSSYNSTDVALSQKDKKMLMVICSILFVIEIIFLVFALQIAVKCSKGTLHLFVNVLLALMFPIPYFVLMMLFSRCAKKGKSTFGSCGMSSYDFMKN